MRTINSDLLDGSMLKLTGDASTPKANMSNANYLMGDIYDGDPELGDAEYGDAEYGDAEYGDLFMGDTDMGDPESQAIANYDVLIGDIAEQGGFNPRQIWRKLPKAAKYALGGVGAAGAIYGTVKGLGAIRKALARNKARKQRVRAAQAQSSRSTTVSNQVTARRSLPKMAPGSRLSFYQVIGATVSAYPIAPTKTFINKSLTWCFDQAANTTPFVSQTVNATQPGGPGTDFIIDIPGTAAGQYYPVVFVIIGGSLLTSSPGINFNLTATLPLVAGGSLSIAAAPFTFTLGPKFYCKIAIFPWTLVAAEPVYTAGFYSAANHINIHISGSLPSGSAISGVVPGTMHPWTIGMRNAGI